MIEFLTDYIVENKFLQALTILVAIGTLIFFVWKNVIPALVFLYNVLTKGWKTTVRKIWRPAYKWAVKDYIDVRLIFVTTFFLSLKLAGRIFVLPMAYLILISLILVFPNEPKIPEWSDFPILIVALLISIGISWFYAKPFYQLTGYLMFCYRLTSRRVSKSEQKK